MVWFITAEFKGRILLHVWSWTKSQWSHWTSLFWHIFVGSDGALYLNVKNAKYDSDRVIPVMDTKSAKVVFDYKKSEQPSSQPFFHVSKRTLQWYASKFKKISGIDFHCHVLRHTFATRFCEDNVPLSRIQHLLGHRYMMMTMHYTKHAHQDVSGYVPTPFTNQHSTNSTSQGRDTKWTILLY